MSQTFFTGTSRSTGTDTDRKVLGMVDTAGVYLQLLPGTEHEVCLRLKQTLVVRNTDLFEVLVDSRKMKSVANSLTQYPTAQLQVHPNVLESTGSFLIVDEGTSEPRLCRRTPRGVRQHPRQAFWF